MLHLNLPVFVLVAVDSELSICPNMTNATMLLLVEIWVSTSFSYFVTFSVLRYFIYFTGASAFSDKGHVTNEEARRKIQAAIGEYDELLTLV